ncbi:unnamed protein product, partial [Discosporangium mesarthrocarpum]
GTGTGTTGTGIGRGGAGAGKCPGPAGVILPANGHGVTASIAQSTPDRGQEVGRKTGSTAARRPGAHLKRPGVALWPSAQVWGWTRA